MKINQTYLIGAGFTRAIFGSKALLTGEIIQKLDLCKYPEVQDDLKNFPSDIEQFLTLIDLKCLHSNDTRRSKYINIRNDITKQLVELFDISKLDACSLADDSLIYNLIAKIPASSTIITLNYDMVFDQSLYLSKRWHPNGGYLLSNFPSNNEENERLDNILLLKPHGSINFRTYKKEFFEKFGLDSSSSKNITIELNDKMFPGICSTINPQDKNTKSYVVIMSYVKTFVPDIMNIWSSAIEKLSNANKLTIIGCSLREEDNFLRFAISNFGKTLGKTKKIVEIVDISKEKRLKIEKNIINNGLIPYSGLAEVKDFSDLNDYIKKA